MVVDMERINAKDFDDYFNMWYEKSNGKYSNVLHGSGYVTYPLNCKYSSFSATWEVKDEGYSDYDFAPEGALQIFTDGNLVYNSPYITCDGRNIDYIYIDVSNCNDLRIVLMIMK